MEKNKMKIIFFIFSLTTSLFGQQVNIKINGEKTNIYNDAFIHYIDSIHNSNSTSDTLFILKNDELTENIIQSVINKTNVSFQDSVNINKKLKYHRSLKALNINSNPNVGKGRINIIVISFIISQDKGYKPFENCTVRYFYDQSKKEFEFRKILCDKY